VAVPSLPQEWIAQTRVGGVILLPLDRRNCGGLLARLTVQSGGLAHGRFLSDFGGFMPLRQLNRHDTASHAFRPIDDGQGDRPARQPTPVGASCIAITRLLLTPGPEKPEIERALTFTRGGRLPCARPGRGTHGHRRRAGPDAANQRPLRGRTDRYGLAGGELLWDRVGGARGVHCALGVPGGDTLGLQLAEAKDLLAAVQDNPALRVLRVLMVRRREQAGARRVRVSVGCLAKTCGDGRR
jgi:hypothetical protein